MKKNININLFGILYNIDEDACNLLEQYLSNMKSYFSRQPGGDEIADDIEHRIAELFWELKQNGVEAIDIEMVKKIIEKIGNPEQMDDAADHEETQFQETTEEQGETTGQRFAKESKAFAESSKKNLKEWMSHRKFFRDGRNKMLAGVLSGLAQYCGGGDPLAWRIIFVILTICFSHMMFLPVILYLLAWAIVPEAVTAEERLWMRGEAVTPENIRDEVLNGDQKTDKKQKGDQGEKPSGFRTFLEGMIKMVAGLFRAFLIFVSGMLLFGVVALAVTVISVVIAAMVGMAGITALLPLEVVSFCAGSSTLLFAVIGCLLVISIISVYSLQRWLRGEQPMRTSQSITLTVIWVTALIMLIPLGVGLAAKTAKYNLERWIHVDDIHLIVGNEKPQPQVQDTKKLVPQSADTLKSDTLKSDTLLVAPQPQPAKAVKRQTPKPVSQPADSTASVKL